MSAQDTTTEAKKPSLLRRKFKTIVFVLILLGIAGAVGLRLYGLSETEKLEFNHVEIPEQALPGMEGLKIVFIADIHSKHEQLMKAVRQIKLEKPDLVLISGDFIDALSRVSRTANLIAPLKDISQRFPTYACLGNHDMERLEIVERIIGNTKITLLRNEKTVFYCDRLDREVVIAGVGEYVEYDFFPERCLDLKIDGKNANSIPVILLCHNPKARFQLDKYSWNLMLCGHTHGNQMKNPFTNKPILYRDGDTYTEGFLQMGDSLIFTTRGIGSSLDFRLFCPPEMNIMTVGGQQAQGGN